MKKLLSLLLVLCMMLSLAPLAAVAAQSDDVILECEPTLAGVLALLHRAQGSPEPKTTPEQLKGMQIDVSALPAEQAEAICWAYDHQLFLSNEDDYRQPNRILDRSEALALVYKSEGRPDVDVPSPYMDVDKNCWFYSAVMWATSTELLTEDSYTIANFFPYSIPSVIQLIKADDDYQIRMPVYNEDGLRFEYESEGLCVVGADPNVTELEIPETYQGIPVVGISDGALSALKKLTQVYVPGSVKHLHSYAFDGCTALQWAYLDYGVQLIDSHAFSNCSAMEWIVLPDSITALGMGAFQNCRSLESIRIPKNLTSVNGSLCANCAALEELILSPNVKMIYGEAFLGCGALQSVYYAGTEQQLSGLSYQPDGNEALEAADWYLIPAMPDAVYGFFDMPEETEWSYEGISFCLDNGLMNGMGDGYFQPNGTTTRAQLVTILWRMCEETAAEKAADFIDTQDHWAKNAISWAAENGIVNGVGEGLFAPDAPITREQLVTIFHRFCKEYLEMDVSQTQTLDSFPDSGAVSDWAQDAMQWGVAVKLISGVGTADGPVLQPQGSATRAQIARVIMNFYLSIANI